MKKILGIILILLLLFFILLYWSVSIGPEEIELSEVIEKPISSASALDSDSVVVKASNRYEANALKRFMQGKNYREAWETPIKAPVLHLDSLEILEEGGGHQTHSLKMNSPSGFTYTLRSINKDPDPLIPQAARTLGLENVVIDGISAQHPYGAVLAAALSEEVGLLHTSPVIYYVPKQSGLGKFSEAYGDKLYLLEFETEGEKNRNKIPNFYEILETDDLQELKMEEGENLSINKRAFIKARLFDMLIGDWDRHAKQWGWVIQKKNNKYRATPLAGDRDNAFFRIDGVIPTLLTNELVQPMVRPFEKEIDHVPGFVYPVDVYFLKNSTHKMFVQEAKELQQQLTDEKIEKAFAAWPKQIADLNEKEITEKLKSRRDKLVEYAKTFYREVQKRDLLEEPLKGSEDLKLGPKLTRCFDCQ